MPQTVTPLIEASVASVAETIGEFIKRRRDRLYSLALRIARSPDDAEDAVQDAALKWAQLAPNWANLQDGEALLYRLTVQCALDSVRKRNRLNRHETQAAQKGSEMNSLDSSATLAERRETLGLLRDAVNALPEDERLPVLLCFNEGLSVVDTAKSLDLPRETVRARLQRALAKLRACLGEKGHRLSVAIVLGLLFRDGCQSASASLCERLDSSFAGKVCAQLAPVSAPKPIPHSEFTGFGVVVKTFVISGAAVVALSLVLILNHSSFSFSGDPVKSAAPQIYTAVPEPSAPLTKNASATLAEERVPDFVPSSSPVPSITKPGSEPQTASATNTDSVALAIRELEARSAEKAAARRREIEAHANSESRERFPGATIRQFELAPNTGNNNPTRRNP